MPDGSAPVLPRESWWAAARNIGRVLIGARPHRADDRPVAPRRYTGSLIRRMIGVGALWIVLLLAGGGIALDRVLVTAITRNFDGQMDYVLRAMLARAEIDPVGEVRFNQQLGDQRFLEPASGLYFQVAGAGHDPFRSRSLWDRRLDVGADHADGTEHVFDSAQFPYEKLRVHERDVRLPGSPTLWRFQVAQARDGLDEQIRILRSTLIKAFAVLGLGLVVMCALMAMFGLWPLRKVRRSIAAVRTGRLARVDTRFPVEIAPLVDELNDLLAHNETQGEEARAHAGNLAHALKTPLTVIMNEASAASPDLAATVLRESTTMRRQVDHHLARARAVGRRGSAQSLAGVRPALEAVERAVSRLYPLVTVDLAGDRTAAVHVERQDLEEMLGNLIENAAKYGGGRVFVTVEQAGGAAAGNVAIVIEDDGRGIPEGERAALFERGARLDTGKPGTGLGLAIVRDVAGIYGGAVSLEESEDLGGLQVRLILPGAGT